MVEDREKALQGLESLRGRLSTDSEFELDLIIKEVNRNFDRGWGAPAVFIDINDYVLEYVGKGWIITVILSFQGAADVWRFVKRTENSEQKVTASYLSTEMVKWMAAAEQQYKDALSTR
ncbi:hypothetical protein [Paenibacillus kribbensis]|uniref:hypothetical protein n=1 Tax=Paenibacillus kribbensis TaxID=172713 RepID=UPI000838B66E|nr:hypothetical protein [Paenibacillus kribbensis]